MNTEHIERTVGRVVMYIVTWWAGGLLGLLIFVLLLRLLRALAGSP